MDSKHFRTPTSPNFSATATIAAAANVKKVTEQSIPVERKTSNLNPRYPGLAPKAEDANLFTDYRSKCARNTPVGQQFATRQWLQHNAEEIIQLSRERQATNVGAQYAHASTIPTPVAVVKCKVDSCAYYPAAKPSVWNDFPPTGIARTDAAPPLFGTFEFKVRSDAPKPTSTVTKKYEGGRNSRRG